MQQVRWIIGRSALARPGLPGRPRIDKAIDAAGHRLAYDVVPDGWADEPGPVVAWGLHNVMRHCEETLGTRHGALCGRVGHRTAYSGFAHELGAHLLNDDYVILPIAEVVRRGLKGDTFLRPDTGAKTFAGRVFRPVEFDAGLFAHPRLAAVPPETPCVVASARPIDSEHRYVIAGGRVVDGRRLRTAGVSDVSPDVEPATAALAGEVAAHRWQVAPAYAIDVAMSDGWARLVDVNPFGSTPLLDMDTRRIVEAVSAAALGAPLTSRRMYWAA